jgi:DNA-binding response OmpR family regulator
MEKKILVVDDESEILRFLLLRLEKNGFQVRIAMDGETAISLAEEHRPDLVLLDINLPNLNGYEVAKHLKSQAHLSDMKIIFQTADADVEARARKNHILVDAYMIKPFTSTELFKKIQECLKIETPIAIS